MDTLASSDIFVFEGFRLDRRAGGLFRRAQGKDAPIEIGSRALDVLGVLVARAGEIVSKDEITAAVWPGRVVEDSNLTVQISTLRRVLDQGRAQGSCIQTVAGRGYRLVAPVTRVEVSNGTVGPRQSGASSAPRLSIVVLPFANHSNDPEQQYFTDGITDDLTTDLSRIAGMFVISRNTAFTYRNKLIGTKQIGRELGVRYVLEGSVRRSGNQLRVNTQLIDAATDAHLWADRFDRDIGDLFALQNEITSRLANALGVELIAAEAARPTEHPDALDYILRGRAAGLKPPSRNSYVERIRLFEHALALDPQSVEAQSRLAHSLVGRALDLRTDSVTADLARAEGLVAEALAASPRSPYAHLVKGQLLRAQNRWEEAIPEYETARALDRNSVGALHGLALCMLFTGAIEETIALEEQAIRLGPRDPVIGNRYAVIGTVHLLQSRTDEAIVWLEKARSAIPETPVARAYLASAYALRGEIERAAAELAEARKLAGDDRYSSLARLKAFGHERWGLPKTRGLWEATYLAGLRKAGMPDE
jgi:TolB-like protein/Flp pilus assembly protein TadD